MASNSLIFAFRGSCGLGFLYGPPNEGEVDDFKSDESKNCKDMVFTKNGDRFAWCNGQKVKIISTSDYTTILQLDKPRTTSLDFSPKGTYLATWEPYTAALGASPQENCNLHIWDIQGGALLKSFIQKKPTGWKLQWTDDEYICSRNVNNEVHFFENGEFGTIAKKIFIQKVANFSISHGSAPYHVACYVPGIKGQPSFVRLFVYPNFEGSSAVIAQKSFFKADRTEFFWNKSGSDLLIQTTVDVDKSGASYYGEQNLYYMSIKGETARVMLGKEGPIYSLQWSPKGNEFCVVYGYMPAKATIYNLKCTPVFELDQGPRNEVQYSPLGNKLTVYGFGNLQGNIEVWDLGSKKLINKFKATDTTFLAWSPDGECILTATTSPRLRVGNGYRIFHYTGSLLQEVFIKPSDELWGVKWKPLPEGTFKENTRNVSVQGITSSVPEASKQPYRPPGARGQPSNFKLHEETSKLDSSNASATESKGMTKNQKKNLAKKAKKGQEKQEKSFVNEAFVTSKNAAVENVFHEVQQEDIEVWDDTSIDISKSPPCISSLTADPEKNKKIKTVMKKLDQIQKLKQDRLDGKKLEKNQEDKINREMDLIKELESLQL